MKSVAFLTCCFWIVAPFLCQAQSNEAPDTRIKKMDAALVDYSNCLAERLKTNATKISEPKTMADAVLNECKAKRQALVSTHSKIANDPEDFSNQVVLSFEKDFLGKRIANYDNSRPSSEEATKINTDYYICIHEAYANGARLSADRTVLFKEVEKNCKQQRDAAYATAVQMGQPAESAEKVTQDFTNQIFVAAEVEHSEIIGMMIKSITLYRGSSEVCDNAIQSKTRAKEQEYLDRLASFDGRFRDKATLMRIIDLYYERRVRAVVDDHGAKKFCDVAKGMLGSMGVKVTDYFQ